MTNNKIILQDQQELIPCVRKYQDNINLFITSPKHLIEGTIILVTKSEIYLDFGTKPIIKLSKKSYIKNLVQVYIILNNSYLLIDRPTNKKIKLNIKDWIKRKLNISQKVKLKLNKIDSIKNIYTIDLEKTLEYIKYNKFFHELENIKNTDSSVKGFIMNPIKGGFSVALGGIIAFLPRKQLARKKISNKMLYKNFLHSSMNFKISKTSINAKNVILTRA
jgi:ribosomal protein S1